MADLAKAASTTRDVIGRYFSLVSAVPSGILVVWTTVLVKSGAWSGRPDFAAGLRGLSEVGLGGAIALTLAAIALGVIMHPLQFAFVQVLEGYWGTTPLARYLRHTRTQVHWHRVHGLRRDSVELRRRVDVKRKERDVAVGDRRQQITAQMHEMEMDRGEIERITSEYPRKPEAFMPTRLGNVLRHHEWTVGKAYGIEAIAAVPYMMSVASPADVEYVDDQRSQLDLAVRMTILSLIGTAVTVLFTAWHGVWLLLALIPYASAYVSYRGAVVAASDYGRALGVLVTLNRFALYDRLELVRPSSTYVERMQNKDVMALLQHAPSQSLSVRSRKPPVVD